MKTKLSICLFLCFIFITVNSQEYGVSTSPQKKKVLIEDFTGIHCGNCPAGQEIIGDILSGHPDYFYSIAIHTGHYAVPNEGEPDYRIYNGAYIANILEVSGYPSTSFNRSILSDRKYTTWERQEWPTIAREKNWEDAPVNLWIKSTYNDETRELAIKLEGYYTKEIEEDFNLLNVALVQNNIVGYQSGYYNYVHNHMVRDYLTPLWGDTIYNPEKGKYITWEKIYNLPETIQDIEVKPEDIELIAYICMDKVEILNVGGCRPEYVNYNGDITASLLEGFIPTFPNYGYNFFEARLQNESGKYITSAEFDIQINGKKHPGTWTGNIPSYTTQSIIIHMDEHEIQEENYYEIKLVGLNGVNFEGNSITGEFSSPLEVDARILYLEIKTDLNAGENLYMLKNQDGKIIKEFGPYESGKAAVYEELVELEETGIYCFEVKDLWGDGIEDGYCKIYDENKNLITELNDIESYGTGIFLNISSSSSITSNQTFPDIKISYDKRYSSIKIDLGNNTKEAELTIYSMTGTKISSKRCNIEPIIILPVNNLSPGIYLLSISQEDINKIYKFLIN